MKCLIIIPIIILMPWAFGVSLITHSKALNNSNSEVQKINHSCSTAGLAVQVLDNDDISPELRSKIQLVAFALSLPQVGISIYDAVTTARNLRTQHPNDYDAVQEGLALRREAARRDLEGFPEAWEFVRTHPRGADAWELLTGLPNEKKWVRTNKELLEKLALSDEVEQNFVNLFYTTFRPEVFDPLLPPNWINGVYFNKFGFPDFTVHAPHLPDGSRSVFKNTDHPNGHFDGGSSDMVEANNWALNRYGNGHFEKLANGQCKIKIGNDWILHTWHHHEDGLTMFPVPHSIHSSIQHTGGASVIDKNLEGFFNSPNF